MLQRRRWLHRSRRWSLRRAFLRTTATAAVAECDDPVRGVVIHARAERLRNEAQRNVGAGADDERRDVHRLRLAVDGRLGRADVQRHRTIATALRVDRAVFVHDRCAELFEYAA